MVVTMESERRKDLETLADAAHRLLAKLDERAKKASGRIKTARKIHTRGQSPAAPVAGETKQPGGSGAKSHPRSTAGLGGGAIGSRLVIAANDNGMPISEAGASGSQFVRANDGIPHRDDMGSDDRAVTRSRVDW